MKVCIDSRRTCNKQNNQLRIVRKRSIAATKVRNAWLSLSRRDAGCSSSSGFVPSGSMLGRLFIALWALPLAVYSFNPASPSNDTSSLASVSSASLILNWSPNGQLVYENGLARVQGSQTSSIAGFRAVLQRYSESNYTDPTYPGPPWISLTSCDNSTDAAIPLNNNRSSPEQAAQSGAIARILYSTTSETCLYDPASSGASPDPYPSDLYVTTSRAVAVDLLERFNMMSYPILWHRADTLRIDNDRIQRAIGRIGGSVAPTSPTNSTNESYAQDYVLGTILLPPPRSPTLILGSWRNRTNSGISPTNKIVVYSVAACVATILATVMLLSATKTYCEPYEEILDGVGAVDSRKLADGDINV